MLFRSNMDTVDQVRKRLGEPRPEDVLRIGTAGQVVLQWVYRGPTDIYVTFRLNGSSIPMVMSVQTQNKK